MSVENTDAVPQEKVNALLAEERRKTEAKAAERLKTLEQELEAAKKKGGDTVALTAKIEELNNLVMTKEQLAKKEAEEAKAAYEAEQARLRNAETLWQNRYLETVRKQAINRAAIQHDAFDPDQLELLLAPNTQVREKTDNEGKGTGEYEVVTALTIEGKQLTLPVGEAVEKMRGEKKYANQFKAKGQPGTGLTLNNLSGGQGSVNSVDYTNPNEMAKFIREQRKTGQLRK